jgi:signal peptidase I
MKFNIDSWYWKIAVVVALLVTREFVRALSPKEKGGERGETSKWLVETIDSAAIAIGLVLFIIQPFILQAFFIPSGSMEDTLRIGDRLLVSKMVYRLKEPAFQDVIVFKAPEAALMNQNGPKDVDFIKRCMGLPGDTVEIRKRRFFRNGVEVKEPYTRWSDPQTSVQLTGAPDEGSFSGGGSPRDSYDMKIVGQAVYSREYLTADEPGPWTQNNMRVADADQKDITNAKAGKVPDGFYLFLGDHRNNSNDGHVWGFAPRTSMVGKAICVFWPPTRLGLVDRMSFFPRKP